jgi:hypothetical protein
VTHVKTSLIASYIDTNNDNTNTVEDYIKQLDEYIKLLPDDIDLLQPYRELKEGDIVYGQTPSDTGYYNFVLYDKDNKYIISSFDEINCSAKHEKNPNEEIRNVCSAFRKANGSTIIRELRNFYINKKSVYGVYAGDIKITNLKQQSEIIKTHLRDQNTGLKYILEGNQEYVTLDFYKFISNGHNYRLDVGVTTESGTLIEQEVKDYIIYSESLKYDDAYGQMITKVEAPGGGGWRKYDQLYFTLTNNKVIEKDKNNYMIFIRPEPSGGKKSKKSKKTRKSSNRKNRKSKKLRTHK